jgi:hypothetical protein
MLANALTIKAKTGGLAGGNFPGEIPGHQPLPSEKGKKLCRKVKNLSQRGCKHVTSQTRLILERSEFATPTTAQYFWNQVARDNSRR